MRVPFCLVVAAKESLAVNYIPKQCRPLSRQQNELFRMGGGNRAFSRKRGFNLDNGPSEKDADVNCTSYTEKRR